MKRIIFIAFLIFSSTAQAAGVYLHGLSFHAAYEDKLDTSLLNPINYGMGVYFPITSKLKLETGVYKNSFYLTSKYVGVQHKILEGHNIEAGLNYSIVTGYPVGVPALPLVIPYVEAYRVRVVLIPDYRMLALGFSFRLK